MSVIMPVSFIESAVDSLTDPNQNVLTAQAKEFHSLGLTQREQILNKIKSLCNDDNNDFLAGYILGIQTCRIYLARNPVAIRAGIEI